MLLLTALALSALAESLPGVDLPFEQDSSGHWVLADELPQPYLQAGVEPGWELIAVDGRPAEDLEAIRRQVAAGPARELQLLFRIPVEGEEGEAQDALAEGELEPAPPEETVLVVARKELVRVSELGLLPYPEDFSPPPGGWVISGSGAPLLVDASGVTWLLDEATGAQHRAPDPGLGDGGVPEIWWSLSGGDWVLDLSDRFVVLGRDQARSELRGAARIRSFQGGVGDHLLLPRAEGLLVLSVERPRGTPDLPECAPAVPETCLASGRQILAQLGDLPGAPQEALDHLNTACAGGVYRGCYEAVALEIPELATAADECLEGQVSACHRVSAERLRLDGDQPSQLSLGLLELACSMDASGSLGERLRRLEDVGEGCMMLAGAYEQLGLGDRSLLALDQACVLGRADACSEAADRRHAAFASRTVRECEDPELPVAAACVELGQLLQQEEVPAASLDDFDAFLRGCSLGEEAGCILLGDYVDRWGIENPRVTRAEQALRASCEEGEQRACLGVAHLLVRHEPRSAAYGEALSLFDQACQAGIASACIGGAEQRRIGKARWHEAPEPVEMWSRACELASADGCAGLGDTLARSRSTWPTAYDAWTRSCELGQAHSCTELGLLVEERHKEPWPGEQPADTYLQRGCDSGDPEGCYWLAEDEIPRRGEPPEPAYIMLERSCEGEFGQGCAELAEVHLKRRTSFDDEIAARHLQTACDNGHFDSCKELGEMFQRGKGVERDRDRARELLERFRFNAPRKHLRLGPALGFPFGVAAQGELVAPIPVGPAISVTGSYTRLPLIGSALLLIEGDDTPEDKPDLQYWDATARLYPNNKARGLYGAVGYHSLRAVDGGGVQDRSRDGVSVRFGLHNDNKRFYSNLELGIGRYGVIDISDFDEEEQGQFPLILSVLSLSFGASAL